MSPKYHLYVLDAEVGIYTVPMKVGVHAGLPINEVFGLARTIKDKDLNPHALLHASAVILAAMIGLITSVIVAIVVLVTAGWTRVASAIEILIVRGCIVRARCCARWGLTIVVRVVKPGVIVSVSMWVTPKARGVLVIVIVFIVTGCVCSVIGVTLIIYIVCGGHGDCRTDGHLSRISCPGDSPSSSCPEAVGHHVAYRGAGCARPGPSVGWVIALTCRVLGRRLKGAQAMAGIAAGVCGPM